MDIRNELRAIDKLCKLSNKNIIRVLEHGRLNNTAFYFIDMELCNINLRQYLHGTETGVPGLIDLTAAAKDGQGPFLVVAIFQQLVSGLSFIHGHNEVHRDLAPENGVLSAICFILTGQSYIQQRAGGG
jgi:serine/threonine protein kinase